MRSITLPILLLLALCGCNRSPEAKMAKFIERGRKLQQSKDYNRAELEYRNAIKAMPKSAEPYYRLGLMFLEKNETGPAAQSFAKATEADPSHTAAQIKLNQMMAASREKDWIERATVNAQNMAATAPNDMETLNLLAMTELKSGKPQDAAKHLEEALKIMPDNLKVASNLATIKLVERDFRGAEKVLQDVQAAAPKSEKPYIALGRFYLMMRQPEQARQSFLHALKLAPNDVKALRDLADLARSQGKFQEAAQSLEKLSKLPPAENRLVYGRFLYEEGKPAEAAAEFERLVKQDANDREAWLLLLNTYVKSGRPNDAGRTVAEALKRNPNNTDALLQRAQLYLRAGRVEDARVDIQKVLGLSKTSAVAHYLLGTVRQRSGDPLAARQEFSEAVNANPSLVPARTSLAQVLISENRADMALELLKAAPAAQKDDPRILAQQHWALMAMGKWPELRASLDRVLATQTNPELLLQDGMYKVQNKDYAGGEKSLAQAIDLAPEDLRALKALAGIYMSQKQPERALQKVTEYAGRYPKSIAIQEFLGGWLRENGKASQAKAVFIALKAAHPEYLEADLAIAQTEFAEGRKDEARKRLAALTKSPQVSVRANLVLGTLEESDGRADTAIDCYRAAVRQEPQNVMALNNLASLLGEVPGSLDSALEYARQAKNLAPDSGVVLDTLGWLLFRKGQFEQSVVELEQAIAKLPTALPKYHLAMAYSKNRKPDNAQKMLEAALKLDPNIPEAKIAVGLVLGR